jgi:hypothetical protein
MLCVVYAAIAVAALIATWSNGGFYIHSWWPKAIAAA